MVVDSAIGRGGRGEFLFWGHGLAPRDQLGGGVWGVSWSHQGDVCGARDSLLFPLFSQQMHSGVVGGVLCAVNVLPDPLLANYVGKTR